MALTQPEGLTLTVSEVSHRVDLSKIFGVDISNNRGFALAAGQFLIDRMVKRTRDDNKDINGRSLKKYSKKYAESEQFKAFGKDEGDVNLTLRGFMLSLIDILEVTGSVIKIGWRSDTENAKAYNHNVGDTVKPREFFGVTNSDATALRKEFKDQIKLFRVSNKSREQILSALRSL